MHELISAFTTHAEILQFFKDNFSFNITQKGLRISAFINAPINVKPAGVGSGRRRGIGQGGFEIFPTIAVKFPTRGQK